MTYTQLFAEYPVLAYSLLGIIALLIGSFLNAVIYRLPLMLFSEQRQECSALFNLSVEPETKVNLFFPRSFCPNCREGIKAIHNIPLLSYLWLRGACYHCKHPISWRYPLVEALSLGLSLYAGWHFGFSLTLCFALIFIWILLVLIFIDLKYQLLPDVLTLSLLWLGLMANLNGLFVSLPEAVIGALVGYLGLWLFMQLFYWMTGKIGMGHGDFKLFAALGAWFGWSMLPLILLGSSVSGAFIGIAYLKIKQQSRQTPIPFGPFLCLAGFIALFWGAEIMHGYFNSFR